MSGVQTDAEAIIAQIEAWALPRVSCFEPNPACGCPNCKLMAAYYAIKEFKE